MSGYGCRVGTLHRLTGGEVVCVRQFSELVRSTSGFLINYGSEAWRTQLAVSVGLEFSRIHAVFMRQMMSVLPIE